MDKPDGLYLELPRSIYDNLNERQNWSRIKLIGRSPAHFQHAILNPEIAEDTAARLLGRACHHSTLEPEKFRALYCVWDGGRRAGNAWESFKDRAAAEEREILSVEQHATALEVGKAVRTDAVAKPLVSGGKREVTVLWTAAVPHAETNPDRVVDLPVAMKSRLDFVADVGALVDLKTFGREGGPEAFGKQCVNYDYHGQAALYRDAYFAATGKKLPYKFVLVETEAPYVVTVLNVPDRILELGRDRYRELLTTYLGCRESNHYPGYAETEIDLELPHWAMPFDEKDPDGMGLTFK